MSTLQCKLVKVEKEVKVWVIQLQSPTATIASWVYMYIITLGHSKL